MPKLLYPSSELLLRLNNCSVVVGLWELFGTIIAKMETKREGSAWVTATQLSGWTNYRCLFKKTAQLYP